MSRREERAPSQRQLRVGEELRHALAMILERDEVRDPRLGGVAVTVTEVRIGPDLRNATAYVVPLGGGDAEAVVAGLNGARPFLRHRLAGTVRLKYAPDLMFEVDRSFEAAGHIDDLLRQPAVARDLARPEADATPPDATPPDATPDDHEGDDHGA